MTAAKALKALAAALPAVGDIETYKRLRAEIEGQVAAYDASEVAFDVLFANLLRFENLQGRAVGAKTPPLALEQAFALAAGVGQKQPATISELMAEAHQNATAVKGVPFFEQPWTRAAVVQDVAGELVPPDAAQGGLRPRETGAHPYEDKFEPRTEVLIKALFDAGVYADDLLIWRGQDRPGRLRGAGYTIIGIPRWGRQVAVSDRLGEACFVSESAQPLAFWTKTPKDALVATAGIARVVSREGWTHTVVDLLKQGLGDIAQRPKVKLPQKNRTPLLDVETIKAWAWAKLQRDGEWPSHGSKEPPIVSDGQGGFKEVEGEAWVNIQTATSQGQRGLPEQPLGHIFMELYKELTARGIDVSKPKVRNETPLNVETIKAWAWAKLQRDGEWPSQSSKEPPIVSDGQGGFVEVEREMWVNIQTATSQGQRGLPEQPLGHIFMELYEELKARGINVPKPIAANKSPVTEVFVKENLHATYLATGSWHSTGLSGELPVYGFDPDGVPVLLPEEKWHSYRAGSRGLPKGWSLADCRNRLIADLRRAGVQVQDPPKMGPSKKAPAPK